MDKIDLSDVVVNHKYVMFFVTTFLFGSTFQAGWALAECGQVGLVLDKKLGWNAFGDDSEQVLFNSLTISTILASVGMGIGGSFAGSLIPRYGSRKVLLFCNTLAVVFNIIKIIETSAAIMIGRFMFGFLMGIAAVCLSKVINDTVPAKYTSQYGAFVNAGLGCGCWASNVLGLMIPIDSSNESGLKAMMAD